MPIAKATPGPFTIRDQIAIRNQPIVATHDALAQSKNRTAFFRGVFQSMRTNSLSGSLIDTAGRALASARSGDDLYGDERDGGEFDPWDFYTPEFLETRQYLIEDYESGRMDFFDGKRRAFERFLLSRHRASQARQDVENAGFIPAMIGQALGDLPLMFLTGGGSLAATAGKTARFFSTGFRAALPHTRRATIGVLAYANAGSTVNRVYKHAALGSFITATNEAGLYAIQPHREVRDWDLPIATAMGAGIGAVLPLLTAGIRSGSTRLTPNRHINKMREDLEASMARRSPNLGGADALDDEVANLTHKLKQIPTTDESDLLIALRHPKTDELIERLRKRWADHGRTLKVSGDPTVAPHPGQHLVDQDLAADVVHKAGETHQTLLNESAAGKVAKISSMPFPAAKLRASAATLGRVVSRVFFNFSDPVAEAAKKPVTHISLKDAEMLKLNMSHLHATTQSRISLGYSNFKRDKLGGTEYLLGDGKTKLRVGGMFGNRQFHALVWDVIQQRKRQKFTGAKPTYEAPASVSKAADDVQEYMLGMFDKLDEAGMLRGPRALATAKTEFDELAQQLDRSRAKYTAKPSEKGLRKSGKIAERIQKKTEEIDEIEGLIEEAEYYLTRRYRRDLIAAAPDEFVDDLAAQWHMNMDTDPRTGKALSNTEKRLHSAAISKLDDLDRAAIESLGIEGKGVVTEADLLKCKLEICPPLAAGTPKSVDPRQAFLIRYRNARRASLREAAEDSKNKILDINNADGVDSMHPGASVFKGRTLTIDENTFRKWLDTDIKTSLEMYDHVAAGRIATRLAINRNSETLSPLVQAVLGENLDGTPDQLIRAINRDFANLHAAAGKLGSGPQFDRVQKAIKHSQKQTVGNITAKLAELEGRPVIQGNNAADASWRKVGQIAMRLPYLAWMGMVTASSIPDAAGNVIAGGVKASSYRYFGRGIIGMLPGMKIPLRGLEALYVALDETAVTRMLALGDLTDMSADPRMASGFLGRAIAYADIATDKASRGLAMASGMNRWNVNMRRVTAHLVMQNIIEGAKRMELAGRLMRTKGLTQEAAIKAARLAPDDATRLAKWGFNAQRSKELLEVLQKHALDADGAKIANIRAHRGQVSPEYYSWHNENRELFETFTAAINAEVMDIIIDPKLLSRPLMNQRWIGRMVNQFWSFSYAWGNQFAVNASMRPGMEQAVYLSQAVMLGGIADAVHNHLSGRRSFAESAERWSDPKTMMGMLYSAAHRSGATSWLARPSSMMDRYEWGPGHLLGENVSSLQSRQGLSLIAAIGPFADYYNRAWNGVLNPALSLSMPDAHITRRLMPWQNLMAINAIYRFTADAGLNNPLGHGKGLDLYLFPTRAEAEARKKGR